MAHAQRLHLRLFLEGVEVPVVSATVQSQKNAAAVASIQIPANDYALEFKPRTLVHLFFYDLYHGAPPEDLVEIAGAGIRIVNRPVEVDPDIQSLFPPERFEVDERQSQVDLENSNYRLLFGGEIMGFGFEKTPASRGIVLQCQDWSSYWDIAFQYQIMGFSLGRGGIRAAFTGAATSVFNDFLEGTADITTKLMSTPPRSYPKLKGTLLGGVVHIIEAIGGMYYGKRAVRGVNDFFSLAEMKLHLTQMVGANPFPQGDETRLLRARGFGSLFRRSLAGLGKLVSVRQVLLALQRYIFHEIIPITTPRFIPPPRDPNLPQVERVGLADDQSTRSLATAARLFRNRAENLRDRQEQATDSAAAERLSRQRGGLGAELRSLARAADRAARRARVLGLQNQNQAFQEISASFAVTGSRFNDALNTVVRVPGSADRAASLYTSDTRGAAHFSSVMELIMAAMSAVLEQTWVRRVPRAASQPDPPPRLLTQIYRPDVWMTAPPRCNVIFPELYSSFNYGRDFTQEVTRLLLRTHSAFFGSDIFFDGFYIAPFNVIGARTGTRIGRGRTGREAPHENIDMPAWVVRDLMDHELFTGIIPTFERMSDLNLHALRGGNIDIEGVRVGYAQLAANHIFFQYRFRSRQLACSGKFNPYIAFGFPALIVDKYLPLDRIRDDYDAHTAARIAAAVPEGEGDLGVPGEEQDRIREANHARAIEALMGIVEPLPNSHYLGTPESLMHSVSATAGGQTQMQMSYARTTNEKTEFFGDNVGFRSRARRMRNSRIHTEVACFGPPELETKGPRGGRIVNVEDVTSRYSRRQTQRTTDRTPTGQTRYVGGTSLPLFIPGHLRSGRRRRGSQVLVGVEQPASSYNQEVVALVGTGGTFQSAVADGRDTLVTFRAYKITEEVGVYARESVDLPPEEITFPPWYGDQYRANRIGGLYSYFFGTGAITDPTTFLAPGGIELPPGVVPEDEENAERSTTIEFAQRMEQSLREGFRSIRERLAAGGDGPQAEFGDTPEIAGQAVGVPGEREGDERVAVAEIEARSHLAASITQVVKAYSVARLNGFDVNEFLRAYTWRPVATAVDILGTANLEINAQGEVVRGVEGFHSRAFGDFDDLRQLVGPGDGERPRTILGLSTRDPDETRGATERETKEQRISARLDTRKERRLPVLRYLYGLMAQRGIVG